MYIPAIFLYISCSGSESDSAALALKNTQQPLDQSNWSNDELTKMEKQVHTSDALQEINDIEDAVANIESEFLNQWQNSWKNGDTSFYSSSIQEKVLDLINSNIILQKQK